MGNLSGDLTEPITCGGSVASVVGEIGCRCLCLAPESRVVPCDRLLAMPSALTKADAKKFEAQLTAINHRLKVAQLGLKVEQRGGRLVLRGTLPPKPGSTKTKAYQQRISLQLPPNLAGLKQAEREAKVVAAQLITETFDWDKYQIWRGRERLDQETLSQQIKGYERHFFQQPERQAALSSTQTTWESAYQPYLRKLEAMAQGSRKLALSEAICLTVESFPPNARARQICCTALAAFAEYLELKLPEDFKERGGNYSAAQVKRRDLPTDEEILAAYELIPHEGWKFVFGVMATYGLRNHEVFFCDYGLLKVGNASDSITVLDTTKTGEHEVWPFFPDWIDRFDLRHVQLPKVNRDLDKTTLQRIGQQVTRQFKRYSIPFSPYDLRHAWAVRTIHFGLPDTVAAKMMGHSVAIHTRTYHKWITRRDQQVAVDAALKRNGNG